METIKATSQAIEGQQQWVKENKEQLEPDRIFSAISTFDKFWNTKTSKWMI